MAKRKRLAPAQPRDLSAAPLSGTPLETKAMTGLSAHPAPPIASVASDASTAAALEELSSTLRRARAEGRMVLSLPLAQIDESYLMRDRVSPEAEDEDMQALEASIAARGQQTPIEVVELGADHYGLISGWRRLQALRSLGQETVKALITPPREAPEAYVAMIEENEIRVGLSYFERARIVVKATDSGVFESYKTALQRLYSTASRAKRSKIKSFIPLVEHLGPSLRFPAQLGERLGLQLSKCIIETAGAAASLKQALTEARASTAEAEQEVLKQSLKSLSEPNKAQVPQRLSSPAPRSATPAEAAHDAPRPKRVTPSIVVTSDLPGQCITLTGHGVDAQLREDLERWLVGRL